MTKMAMKIIMTGALLSLTHTALAGNWSAQPYELPLEFQQAPTETKAALRIGLAPTMPPTAERSGYCCMKIDISASGKPRNIRTSYCSDKAFKSPSIEASKQWRFDPAVKNGKPIAISGQVFSNKFRLQTQSGRFIPDPNRRLSADPRKDPDAEELCRADLIS